MAADETTLETPVAAPDGAAAARRVVLGVDVGGSGIKAAPVDVATGELVAERHRIPTPRPSTPEAVAGVVGELVRHFDYAGPVGVTFPAVVLHGTTLSAANVDDAWIGADADALFTQATGLDVHVLNDADAAGVAEMTFGAGRGQDGVVLLLTFGTGIGSALFVDGTLVPNTELGHLEFRGMEAEHYASDRVRKREELGWKRWAKRVDELLGHYEMLFTPDLIVLGGGVSKKADRFLDRLEPRARLAVAELRNEAGIVGAALVASRRVGSSRPARAPAGP